MVSGTDGQLVVRSEVALRGVATVDIRVPMEFKTRSGRKEIISVRSPSGLPPDAAVAADVGPRSPLVVALARAYRWQRMIETGQARSNSDLARKLKLDQSYIARTIRLASLAPEIIEAILGGQEPDGLSLWGLRRDVPLLWREQRKLLGMEGK
jgi:hypothetical protein